MSNDHVAANSAWSRRWRRLQVCLGAVLGAVAVFVIAVPILGIEITVPERPGSDAREPLELSAVVPAALMASFAGWASLAGLERAIMRPRAVWTAAALVAYAATLPYMPGFDLAERLILTVMHSTLATILTIGLRHTSPTAKQSTGGSAVALGGS